MRSKSIVRLLLIILFLLGIPNPGLFYDSVPEINAKVVIYGTWEVLYNDQGEYIGERCWKTPSTCVVVIQ